MALTAVLCRLLTALSRSLNIPSVKTLQEYSTDRFYLLLAKCGITSFRKPADYYGLSMILGGGEVSLWELTGMYASMSRVLKEYNRSGGYTAGSYRPPALVNAAAAQNAGDEAQSVGDYRPPVLVGTSEEQRERSTDREPPLLLAPSG
ncbi:MAG: hypothetical protein U5L72_01530 [Bacteroidales bacterium]|nr:hypothetical protein [Bacteroidales bacterium]